MSIWVYYGEVLLLKFIIRKVKVPYFESFDWTNCKSFVLPVPGWPVRSKGKRYYVNFFNSHVKAVESLVGTYIYEYLVLGFI